MIPSDRHIQQVGQTLGHGPGPYDTKTRAQIAKTIQEAEGMAERQAPADQDEILSVVQAAAFAKAMNRLHGSLRIDGGFSFGQADKIASSVAPELLQRTLNR